MTDADSDRRKYQLLLAEPGILIEILLPKKSRFQGTLHESLKEGADIKKIRRHFADEKDSPHLKRHLGFYDVFAKYTEPDIAKFETVFRGYSIYEVDGVFYVSNQADRPPDEFEERTQIIKLIFLPQYGEIKPLSRERQIGLARVFLPLFPASWKNDGQTPNTNLSFSPTRYDDALSPYVRDQIEQAFGGKGCITDDDKLYILYLIRWTNYVGLWVFGYLMYKIVKTIDELKDSYAPEAEIWVTSHWDYLVNKLIYPSTSHGSDTQMEL
jgi:hypothetical protein